MKSSDKSQIAIIAIGAMLLGSGLTWYLLREQPAPPQVPAAAIPQRSREALSRIKPSPLDPQIAGQVEPLDDAEFEKAIAAAKAARKAGTLQPLASTPEEFARVLGKWNFAIHDFVQRFPKAPDASAPEFAAYRRELDTLTASLANLLSDEELTTRLDVETPPQRARYQANLAAGSLDLDAATTAKLEASLAHAYEEMMPLPTDDAALETKVEAMNAKILGELDALLTPAQRERLNVLGVERVLLGLAPGEG
jgi:hypothetical protein